MPLYPHRGNRVPTTSITEESAGARCSSSSSSSKGSSSSSSASSSSVSSTQGSSSPSPLSSRVIRSSSSSPPPDPPLDQTRYIPGDRLTVKHHVRAWSSWVPHPRKGMLVLRSMHLVRDCGSTGVVEVHRILKR
ncbi:hypothetical protein Tco_0939067 [Tanacetum coccineum]|uniref:Uncharacterized protein n=1 Tax=Tanacetum coccineum TaxID=301880 RepID=A0ABQ5DJU0_9ASTR